ncbi:MAG TPA: carbohydrate kinase family protein [Anaerolineales bacterium]|nr:carbohydrate kinase family protein [Anaerolineales bacterium]
MTDQDAVEAIGVVVIGSSVMDVIGRPRASLQPRSSVPGVVRLAPGGVARNVAENLARLGVDVTLITAVGDDPPGRQILSLAEGAGVNVQHALCLPGERTGMYLGVLDGQGGLQLALDDMGLVSTLTPDFLRGQAALIEQAQAVFLDANVPPESLDLVIRLARRAGVPLAADPTSVSLAANLHPHLKDLWLITPNAAEAEALCPHPVPHSDRDRALDAARHLVSEGVDIALVTMAEYGVGYASAETSGHIPAVETEVVDPTGAGDAQTAAVLFGLLSGIPLDESVRLGASAAALTLRTPGSVVPDLTLERLYEELR